jgi:putative CocE/NonD family hydrolase
MTMLTSREPADVPAGAEQVHVPMRDGTRLATDVYLPSGPGPFPAIVTRLPYDKANRENMVPFVAGPANERGYALVAQDTRGKFRSEGEMMPFVSEAVDGYDTLEWVSAQSWCNDDVAMSGASYYGFTQWAAVASAHPRLRAIAPTITATALGTDWFWRQGIFQLGLWAGWCAITWSHRELYEWDLELPWHVRPLADVLTTLLEPAGNPVFDRLAGLGPHDPFWSDAAYLGRNPVVGSSVPALHQGGWWDIFSRGQIADWALASATSGSPQHLVMDAYDHFSGEWTLEPPGLPDFALIPDAELTALGEAAMQPQLDFFDHVLRGRGDAPPPVSWKLTHEDWRTDEHWPPTASRSTFLYLQPDGDPAGADGGRLGGQRAGAGRWASWIHDSDDLVPTQGMAMGLTDLVVPPDDELVEHRPDVMVFTTEPLDAPMDLAGPILAELQLASSAPSMHVVVRLIDVFPDGRTRRIRDGAALVRDADAEPHVVVDLGPTGYRVRPGHRLRVHVASSDFPRYLPYFGDERDPWTATNGVRNEQRIRLGGSHGSRLVLTTL